MFIKKKGDWTMKILILNGSPKPNGNTKALTAAFTKGAESNGHEVVEYQVGKMDIKGCIACEYCHNKGEGACIQKDDMQQIYPDLADADVVVLASPVYYFGFTGQIESTISRFYAPFKPNATKFALIVSSMSPNVQAGIEAQYKAMLAFFGAEDLGIKKVVGDENKSEAALAELEAFGKSIG